MGFLNEGIEDLARLNLEAFDVSLFIKVLYCNAFEAGAFFSVVVEEELLFVID